MRIARVGGFLYARGMTKTSHPAPPHLAFESPVLALGGGSFDADALRPLLGQYPLIAADSGGDAARELGVMPAYIIGDFDSLADASQFPQNRLIRLDAQSSTDLEKTLSCLATPLCLGFGFLGRRFDHSLASLHALAGAKFPVLLVGRYDAVRFCRGDFRAELPQNARLSIWPLSRQNFIGSKGLEWALDGLEFEAGKMIGTSNRTIANEAQKPVEVAIQAGAGAGYFIMLGAAHWRYLVTDYL